MNYKMIRYTLGIILIFEAAFLLVPLVTALLNLQNERHCVFAILITIGICLALGILSTIWKPKDRTLYTKDGFAIVALSWITLSLFGALPFVFSGTIPNYIDALFETASGFSTTGSSILAQVSTLPSSMIMWRSFTHWVGGMGVLVFIMAILPLGGAQNMHIMRAESPGPEVSKLVPRVRKSAIILYSIYFVMTVIQFLLLLIGEMTPFEALNTAFATAGTGGFGFRDDSFLSFGAYSQIIVTVFMLLFSVNFNSYYLVLKGKFKSALNSEVKLFLVIVLTATAIISASLVITGHEGADNIPDAIRHSAFTVASLISTTGFSTLDFDIWPNIAQVILVMIMFMGACAGSTGGGFKVSRVIILIKGMAKEIGNLIHPRRVKKISVDGRPVSHEVIRSVNAYLVIYVVIFAASFIAISFDNYVLTSGDRLVTNFTAVTAAINNIGPGLDMVGPTSNFAHFSPFSKLVLIFDMLAGRLELLPMLLLFSPALWQSGAKKETKS